MGSSTTPDRILDAAERLFAEHGIAGTSLRAVTKEAGVNLASIHYHFGSKDALCHAVFARRVGPVNRDRLRRLAVLEREAAPDAARIVDAFIEPVVLLKRDLGDVGGLWSRLIGRMYCEPAEFVETLIREQFGEVARRFVAALERALPHLSTGEVYERFDLLVAALTHFLSDSRRLHLLADYRPDPADEEGAVRRMCGFLTAALRAPAAAGESAVTDAAAPGRAGAGEQ